jgi:hypothetical protein
MKAIITKFSAEGKHKGALSYTQENGKERFFIKVECITGSGANLDLQIRNGFVSFGQALAKQFKSVLVEGADLNKFYKAIGQPEITVVYDKSTEAFHKNDSPVLKPDGTEATNKDGDIFYRSARVLPLGSRGDMWIDVEEETTSATAETVEAESSLG